MDMQLPHQHQLRRGSDCVPSEDGSQSIGGQEDKPFSHQARIYDDTERQEGHNDIGRYIYPYGRAN